MKKGLLCLGAAAQAYAAIPTAVTGTGPLYTVGFNDNQVYAVDVPNNNFISIGTAGSSLNSIVLIDRNTAYIGSNDDHTLYRMNLQNGSSTPIAIFPLDFSPAGVAILNETTAFVTGFSKDVYTLNQQTGQISLFAHIPSAAALVDIEILNNSTAYIADISANNLYFLDLKTGATSIVATFPGTVQPISILLANQTTAYVAGAADANIYTVDLTTGAITLVTPSHIGSQIPGQALDGLSLEKNTLYTVNYTDTTLFAVDRETGLFSALLVIPGAGINWTSLYLQMVTDGLSGNNLKLANYLNANAPQYQIRSFALLAEGLPAALEATSPARNGFTTYAAQTAYLASSQLLIDHSRRVRLNQEPGRELTADASRAVRRQVAPSTRKHHVWFTPFGESAHEKRQMQTPAFTTSVGGGLLGYDYTTDKGNTIGLGGSYVHTHVHEAHHMGKANINQGFGTIYTTLTAGKWYTDISAWGGYYSSANTRNIKFPGVDVKAQATIHGWQTAAHLEMGGDHFYSWFGVEPFVMGDWVGNWERGFHEHGAGFLNMGQKRRFASLVRAEGGLRLHEMIKFENGSYLLFREKASYAYQKAFHTGHITAFLVGVPGSFTVNTLTTAQNLGVFEFALGYHGTQGAYFEARYQVQYGSMYQSHQGMLEIGWDF
jgi:uncharacterized protein with beta-barrel porin domain